MSYEHVRLEFRNQVAVLTLNAPQYLNALSATMVQEVNAAVMEAEKSDARCLLMTGEGRAFSAGANLQVRQQADALPPTGSVLETHYHPLMTRLRQMDMTFVTAINGPAVGVGMSLAIMSDFAVASDNAYFLQAFANIGLVPDGGVTYVLPRIVGWRRAMELSMMAERFPANRALEWGLINKVVDADSLMDEAMAVAKRFASGPRSLTLIRKAYWESLNNGYDEQFKLEVALQNIAHQSNDNKEGVAAFLEKREAKFTGT